MKQFKKTLLITAVCFISVFFLTASTKGGNWGIGDPQGQKDYTVAYVYFHGMFLNDEKDRLYIVITEIEPVIFTGYLNTDKMKDDLFDVIKEKSYINDDLMKEKLEEGELEREDFEFEASATAKNLVISRNDYKAYLYIEAQAPLVIIEPDIYPFYNLNNGRYKTIE